MSERNPRISVVTLPQPPFRFAGELLNLVLLRTHACTGGGDIVGWASCRIETLRSGQSAKSALPIAQLAGARADIALDPAVLKHVPVIRVYD